MDRRWEPMPRDAVKAVTVSLFARTASPASIAQGETPLADLTPLVARIDQTDLQLTFTLAWHDELDGASLPRAGQWVVVRMNGTVLCVHRVDTLSEYRVTRGVRQVTVTARSRDATELWRERVVSTGVYALGAPTIEIVWDVAVALGLDIDEVHLYQLGTYVPRGGMQFSSVPAWTVLEQVMLPAGMAPFVDALGRLRGYARDIVRDADVVIPNDRLEGFVGASARPSVTRLSLRWRSPTMHTVLQPERVLAETTVMGGYFRMRQVKRVWYSADRTQRAANTRFVVKESINRLIPFARETAQDLSHDSASETGRAVVVTMSKFVPAFLAVYLVGKFKTAAIPDYAPVVATVSYGRLIEAGLDIAMLLTLLSVGEGQYQFVGNPIDAVETVNTTEAYDPNAPLASSRVETIDSEFVMNQGAAVSFATREFMFRARAATTWNVNIVDDPRIEVGDIVQLESGERLFVTSYRRDLTAGSAAVLELTGFPA